MEPATASARRGPTAFSAAAFPRRCVSQSLGCRPARCARHCPHCPAQRSDHRPRFEQRRAARVYLGRILEHGTDRVSKARPNGILGGRFPPTVRKPIARLPSGALCSALPTLSCSTIRSPAKVRTTPSRSRLSRAHTGTWHQAVRWLDQTSTTLEQIWSALFKLPLLRPHRRGFRCVASSRALLFVLRQSPSLRTRQSG